MTLCLKCFMKNNLNSLGIDKKTKDTVVVVAMSGGVDSSTAAGIMKKDGYNVIGITLKLYDDGKEVAKSKQCCSEDGNSRGSCTKQMERPAKVNTHGGSRNSNPYCSIADSSASLS